MEQWVYSTWPQHGWRAILAANWADRTPRNPVVHSNRRHAFSKCDLPVPPVRSGTHGCVCVPWVRARSSNHHDWCPTEITQFDSGKRWQMSQISKCSKWEKIVCWLHLALTWLKIWRILRRSACSSSESIRCNAISSCCNCCCKSL